MASTMIMQLIRVAYAFVALLFAALLVLFTTSMGALFGYTFGICSTARVLLQPSGCNVVLGFLFGFTVLVFFGMLVSTVVYSGMRFWELEVLQKLNSRSFNTDHAINNADTVPLLASE